MKERNKLGFQFFTIEGGQLKDLDSQLKELDGKSIFDSIDTTSEWVNKCQKQIKDEMDSKVSRNPNEFLTKDIEHNKHYLDFFCSLNEKVDAKKNPRIDKCTVFSCNNGGNSKDVPGGQFADVTDLIWRSATYVFDSKTKKIEVKLN